MQSKPTSPMSHPGVAPAAAYRPDIDGMRALAVLAVIAFHINKFLLPGGFVGVDIFFVISGYLISAHIFAATASGSFSFVDFYFRRVRRIAPAMLLVLLATLLAAQFLLLPDDARDAAKSAVWSLASLTNVYFWLFQNLGYFAASSSELPLLHLWSLSVEEQFYLIWPVVAVAMAGLGYRSKMTILLAVVLVSTAVAELSFVSHPAFVYYMLPSRCGELLVGAALALAVVHGRSARIAPRLAAPIAWTGLAMVLLSTVLITENMVFPGVLGLPPTVGAALLILAGGIGANPVSRCLALGPMRWIGRLSYPAYLWHWPLLAFYRYGYGEPGPAAGAAVLVLTFALAWMTFRLVEQPAQRLTRRWRGRTFAGWAACSAAMMAAALGFVFVDRLVPDAGMSAYHRQLEAVRARNVSRSSDDYICQRKVLTAADLTDPKCVVGAGSPSAKRVLLLGDSNAAHYVGMVAALARQGGFSFRNLEAGTCPPVMGDVSAFVPLARLKDCTASHKVWATAIADAEVLILGGTWNEYDHTSATFLPMLKAQIARFAAAGKTVVILGKIPVIAGFDRLCEEKAIRYPYMQCDGGSNTLAPDVARINRMLRDFAAATPNVRYFDIEHVICPNGNCSIRGKTNAMLYFDKHHLSVAGSIEVGKIVAATGSLPDAFDFERSR